jgi:hypothetical protein
VSWKHRPRRFVRPAEAKPSLWSDQTHPPCMAKTSNQVFCAKHRAGFPILSWSARGKVREGSRSLSPRALPSTMPDQIARLARLTMMASRPSGWGPRVCMAVRVEILRAMEWQPLDLPSPDPALRLLAQIHGWETRCACRRSLAGGQRCGCGCWLERAEWLCSFEMVLPAARVGAQGRGQVDEGHAPGQANTAEVRREGAGAVTWDGGEGGQ